MSEIFAVALASMHRDMGTVDRVAQNLSNATTPGYKREIGIAQPFAEVMTAAQAAAGEPAAAPSGTGALGVRLDTRPGTVRMTGQPFDVAIEGDGYFEIETDSGPAYTRQGTFRLDARGRLVTAQGFPVMGVEGEIQLTTRTPVIDASGRITEPDAASGPSARAPGTAAAQLKIVAFADPAGLRHAGGGLLDGAGRAERMKDADVRVRQGALENANVESSREMVQLMETMRHFETMQRVVQGYDELLSTSIRKLGDLG